MEKPYIPYPIVVEGKYDKIKITSLFQADVFTTDGFGVFRREDKVAFFRKLSERRPLLILTDSDGAGLVIRNYFLSILPKDRQIHLYTPEIKGKERRKTAPSKSGRLGVEGIDAAILRDLLLPYAIESPSRECIVGEAVAADGACEGIVGNAHGIVGESIGGNAHGIVGGSIGGNARGIVGGSIGGNAHCIVGGNIGDSADGNAEKSSENRDVGSISSEKVMHVPPARGSLTKADLYALGLSGREGSAEKRKAVAISLGFPSDISAGALLAAVNMLYSREEFLSECGFVSE